MDLLTKAADALKQARELPPGAARNELRQVAIALRWLAGRPQSPEQEVRIRQLLAPRADGPERE
jgi:hypothetical protein